MNDNVDDTVRSWRGCVLGVFFAVAFWAALTYILWVVFW